MVFEKEEAVFERYRAIRQANACTFDLAWAPAQGNNIIPIKQSEPCYLDAGSGCIGELIAFPVACLSRAKMSLSVERTSVDSLVKILW